MNARLEERLVNELSNAIARHADWLSGRDQRLAQQVAEAYFEPDDLDKLGTAEEFMEVVRLAVEIAARAQD